MRRLRTIILGGLAFAAAFSAAGAMSVLNSCSSQRPEAAPPRRIPRGDTRRPYAS
jgi:hypothetical protein